MWDQLFGSAKSVLCARRLPTVFKAPGALIFSAKTVATNKVRLGQSAALSGQRLKANRFAPKVLKLVGEGQSYREISHWLGLSKNTVLDIVKRDRAKMPPQRRSWVMKACPFVDRHSKAGLAAVLNVLKIPFRVFSSKRMTTLSSS
jgi:hypothetical protein